MSSNDATDPKENDSPENSVCESKNTGNTGGFLTRLFSRRREEERPLVVGTQTLIMKFSHYSQNNTYNAPSFSLAYFIWVVVIIRAMSMFAEVDTFIGNHTVVDPDIFQLWIEGNSGQFCASIMWYHWNSYKMFFYEIIAQEASTVLQQRGALHSFPGATADFLLADVMDHYRAYGMLEKLLHTPQRISEQWTFQMDLPTQKMLIEQ